MSWASPAGRCELNSVGSAADRARYNETLRQALIPRGAEDVRGLPAPRGDESAAGAGLQGAGGSADHRDAAQNR